MLAHTLALSVDLSTSSIHQSIHFVHQPSCHILPINLPLQTSISMRLFIYISALTTCSRSFPLTEVQVNRFHAREMNNPRFTDLTRKKSCMCIVYCFFFYWKVFPLYRNVGSPFVSDCCYKRPRKYVCVYGVPLFGNFTLKCL